MRFKLFILFLIIIYVTGCDFGERSKKMKIAREDADFIIENLDSSIVIEKFPEKYFEKKYIKDLQTNIRNSQGWRNKRGKFVDFCTMSDNFKFKVAYIYEYILPYDSLRFILFYDFEPSQPELFKFDIEPIELKNRLIIYPEKQLIH